MNIGRIILLGVALLAGGGAFLLVAMGNKTPETEVIAQIIPQQERAETVRVLVADSDFIKGQMMDPAAVKWVKFPKENLPEYFITEDNSDFFDTLGQTLARANIYIGEPITEAKVVRPGDRSMLAALLTPGMRAVTLNIAPETSAAGFVLPGDHVDVYFSEDVPDSENNEIYTELLYSNLRVLAIDQNITDTAEGSMVGRTATLEIQPWQVEDFLTVREAAEKVNLVLRSAFVPADGEEIEQEVRPTEVRVIRYGQS